MSDGSRRRPEYPALGSDGLAAVLTAISDAIQLPAKPSPDQVFTEHSRLFERAFSQLSLLVGAKGAQSITQRAIKRAGARLPFLRSAAVSDARVLLEPLRAESTSPEALREEMEDLFVTTMDVLASLIGVDLLTTLLEQMTSSGSSGQRRGQR